MQGNLKHSGRRRADPQGATRPRTPATAHRFQSPCIDSHRASRKKSPRTRRVCAKFLARSRRDGGNRCGRPTGEGRGILKPSRQTLTRWLENSLPRALIAARRLREEVVGMADGQIPQTLGRRAPARGHSRGACPPSPAAGGRPPTKTQRARTHTRARPRSHTQLNDCVSLL